MRYRPVKYRHCIRVNVIGQQDPCGKSQVFNWHSVQVARTDGDARFSVDDERAMSLASDRTDDDAITSRRAITVVAP